MSDSPKYCAARLRAEQERKLRKKREQKAALELAQRKAEEDRRCGTRLEQGQLAAQKELGEIQTALTALSESDAARFIQTERLEELRSRLRELKTVIQETILEDRVRTASADLRAIREDTRATIRDCCQRRSRDQPACRAAARRQGIALPPTLAAPLSP